MMKSIFAIMFVIFFTFLAFAQPGTVLKTLPSPTGQLADLTWDGDYLYLLGLSDHNIYQIDTTNGNVLNTISTGVAGALGLTYKDGYFWLSVISDHSLKKIDSNGSVIKSVPIPATQNIGIEWNGNAFRIADSGSPDEKILEVDSLGNLLSSFLFPGDSPFGLTWDGSTVWCADNQSSGGAATIYQLDAGDGTVITSFLCPNSGSAANGLTWDGEYLWIADQTNNLIYKVQGNPINHGPQIMVHPDTLDFDSTLTGYTVVRDLIIQNTGTQPLNVLDIFSTDLAFAIDSTHFQVSPSDSFLLPVTFLPFYFDFYSGQLFILSDDPVQDTVSVFLQGWGFDPPIIYPPFVPSEIIETIPEGDSLIVDILFTNNSAMYMNWSAENEYLTEFKPATATDKTIRGKVFNNTNFWFADTNWLFIYPDSGTIPPWSFDMIEAKIYGIIGSPGDTLHQADISFQTNNPVHPMFHLPVEVTVTPVVVGLQREENIRAQTFQLYQNYPNPFNPTTTICYQSPSGGEVELAIYNLLGQQVRTLVNGRQTAGNHEAKWNGRDDRGREVASGIYIFRLKAEDKIISKKMLLLR